MIVDSHQHFWDPALGSYEWMTESLTAIRRPFGPENLKPLLDRAAVCGCVAVQARADLAETRWLLSLADSNPCIVGVVGWVDLTSDDVAGQIVSLRSGAGGGRLVGIRHQVHDEDNPRWLVRPDVVRGLESVAQAGLVYDLLVRPRELPVAYEVAAALPQLQFVIDHLAKPPIGSADGDAWFQGMGRLAELCNVSVKVSGLVTEADWAAWQASDFRPYVEAAIELFGGERLLFGSDWPVCLLAASYPQVLNLTGELLGSLDEAQRAQIFGSNAIRVYSLTVR